MDLRGSYCGKRSFSELQATCHRRPDEEDLPVKKKLRTKLVDLFNRASISMTTPEDHMKVYLRVKPFTNNEDASQRCLVVSEEENAVTATAPELSHTYKSMKRGLGKASHKFTFSRIFHENTTQKDFFNETMLNMTKDFISGQNSLVFTYGVTSSGKTYTIQGQPQDAGILPRCLDVIFNSINGKQITSLSLKPRMFTDVVRLSPEEIALEKRIKEKTLRMSIEDDTTVTTLLGDEMESVMSDTATSSSSGCDDDLLPDVENRDREELKVDVEDQGKIRFGVWVSFAEIYNEQIFDLLEPMPRKKNARRPVLKISDDRHGNPYIRGLKEIHVESADEAYRLLTIGQRNLQTACTRLNHCSSRSHCIFNIKIVRVVDKEDPHIARVSMLSLCDLAGSERYSRTQATGDRLREAGNINTSLMTLGRCIETLRHNQLHRDQQKLVPFRDSKLTRLLQNFFNGSGRAAMIVNVSQCASMFDDTLHVFKFSAIAKQVKYIEKPPEPVKMPAEKKVVSPAQRPSIAWEIQEPSESGKKVLKEAQNEPLPDDDDDDIEDNEADVTPEAQRTMRAYIKALEERNERLVEMLEEEIINSSTIEDRVRQEVIQAMMKQVVNIEETYSAILRETNEEAQEMADERVKGIMEVYEQRLERIQRKIDEDDEWVSSLLFHQEKMKVEERDAKISELEDQLSKLRKELADSKKKDEDEAASAELGNSVLIETLTQKLQEATDSGKLKDEKIQELESLIAEAGEVYNKHMEEISELKKSSDQQREEIDKLLSSIQDLEKKLTEKTSSCDSMLESLRNKEAEWKAAEEEMTRKLKNKDSTISSLQEECKELQDEIERLQDQMSQLDEESRCHNGSESSASSDNRMNTSDSCNSSKPVTKMQPEAMQENGAQAPCETLKKDTEKESTTDMVKETSEEQESSTRGDGQAETGQFEKEISQLKEGIETRDRQAAELREVKRELEEQIQSLQGEQEKMETQLSTVQREHELTVQKLECANNRVEELLKNVESTREEKKNSETRLEAALQEKDILSKEIESLKNLNGDLTNKALHLENLAKSMKKEETEVIQAESENVTITDMVRQIELRNTPISEKDTSSTAKSKVMNESEDSEIVFNPKSVVAAAHLTPVVPKTQDIVKASTTSSTKNDVNSELALKLKDAELANAALRNKLKREEDDFFKREQALIHGYTAEIDNLKYELAKLKTKMDGPGRTRAQRGKRKAAAMDTSTSSAMSESTCEGSCVGDSKFSTSEEQACDEEKQSISILSSELTSVRQQLLSLAATYRILQTKKEGNETNSFIQDVVLGTPKKRRSVAGVFKSEDNVTDSVLQFEIEEYAIRMDEMRMKVQQQEDEMKMLGASLEKMKADKEMAEHRFEEKLQKMGQQDNPNVELTKALDEEKTLREEVERKLNTALSAKSHMEVEAGKQETMIMQLKETLENAISERHRTQQNLTDVTGELNSKTEQLGELELKHSQLLETLKNLTTERNEWRESVHNLNGQMGQNEKKKDDLELEIERMKVVIKNAELERDQVRQSVEQLEEEKRLLKEDLSKWEKGCHDNDAKLLDMMREKDSLEKQLKDQSDELQLCREKLSSVEQLYSASVESLEKTTHSKEDVEGKLQTVTETLTAKEEALKRREEEHSAKILELKQQYCSEGETKSETIAKLQQLLEDFKAKLDTKAKELEKVEWQRQEEAAEVSQKLLMLEREKKVAERKAAEAKEREQEWQKKSEGLDRMKQFEHQLHEQLKTAATSVRKHYEKTNELKEELALTNKERDQLREELASLKTTAKVATDSERRLKELEQTLSSEKEQRLQAQDTIQTYCERIEVLKKGIIDSEETMEQQEKIIKEQDEELHALKTELQTLTAGKERLDHLITRKELETASLNKQVSKLEEEMKSLRQLERKTVEIEQREKFSIDQLQRSNSEKGELEERIQKLEKEKQSLEDKLETEAKRMKTDRKALEELEEKINETEKEKRNLNKEVKQIHDEKRTLEEQLAILKQQRHEEQEQFQQLETQFKNFKKEAEKESSDESRRNRANDELEGENQNLKMELARLKEDTESKESKLQEVQASLKKAKEKLKSLEKELQKQERINTRNQEEMENWKKERDSCVNQLEQLINKRQQDNKQLSQENERLKKDNADLAKNVSSVTSMKDSVIAELRKTNNTLSIQLAGAQGLSPPPKIATPDNSAFKRTEFIEDLDTTGHLEIDATPPFAAKKCRKRHNSTRQSQSSPSSSSSSVDPEVYTSSARKSLKPIEEQNENSPSISLTSSSSKSALHSATGRVAELASEVLSNLSPLTRSDTLESSSSKDVLKSKFFQQLKAKRQQEKETKKKKKTSIQAPFDPASFMATSTQNENAQPYSTRRSSRLRSKSKQTLI